MFQDRGREYVFDERPVFAATAEDLSRTRLEAHFGISPTIPWSDLLRNTHVAIRDRDEVDRPSVAGLLSFGSDPTEVLASAYIEAACYGGTRLSSDELVRAERLAGPLSDQIDAGVAFVMHFMRAGREAAEDHAYDINVVDEAVVNAVAHRDYSVSGSKIRLFLFADRLELYSPASSPTGSRSSRCRTAHSPATSSSSASFRRCGASGPARCSSNHAGRECGRSLKTAKPTLVGVRSTNCSGMSCG